MSPRSWSPLAWVLLVVNVAFLVWLIASLGYTDPCDLRGAAEAECAGPERRGIGIGPIRILGFWLLADLVLGGAWFATRVRRPAAQTAQSGHRKSENPR